MAPEKETIMLLKVDLDCDRCYQKVKRTLCRFPQVRDQLYVEKENLVKIKVVCCSPEKIRDKICARGGRSIKGIQIVEAKPPPPPPGAAPGGGGGGGGEKPAKPLPAPGGGSAPPPGPPAAKPPAEKPKDKPPAADKPKEKPPGAPAPDKIQKNGSKNGGGGVQKPEQQGKPQEKPAPDPKPAKPDPKPAGGPPPGPPMEQQPMPPQAMMQSVPMGVPGYPPPPGIYPVNMHWGPYYEGQPAGMMYPPPPMNDPYAYYGSGGGWNSRPHGGGYCNARNDYFSDENPQACVIM